MGFLIQQFHGHVLMEEKFDTLLLTVQKLSAENESLRARVQNLEKVNHIRAHVDAIPVPSFLANKITDVYYVDPLTKEIKIPYHWVAIWTSIYAFLPLTPYERWKLRSQCKLFRDAISAPVIVKYPSEQWSTLSSVIDALRKAHKTDKKIHKKTFSRKPTIPGILPNLVLLGQGDHEVTVRKNAKDQNRNYLLIDLPLTFVGHGRSMTRIVGGLEVKGDRNSMVPFRCVDLTITGSLGSGVWNTGCLPMEFRRCDFSHNKVMGLDSYKDSAWRMTECNVLHNGSTGIGAKGAQGEIIQCTVACNGNSGVRAQEESSIHIYGSSTTIHSNCGRPSKTQGTRSGLFSTDSSVIYIHEPLGFDVSSNNNFGTSDHKGAIVVVP